MTAEASTHRLVHQLDELELRIEVHSSSAPDGAALRHADSAGRNSDDLPPPLGEPVRTVIGHLRHEVGHSYWARLVAQTDHLGEHRHLFGDERQDHQRAIERHEAGGNRDWNPTTHVTPYAASHPLEDFAECFALYLHILDAIVATDAHQLATLDGSGVPPRRDRIRSDVDGILDVWLPVNTATNAATDPLAATAIYPFHPTGVVVEKLGFVHQRVTEHVARHHFYAPVRATAGPRRRHRDACETVPKRTHVITRAELGDGRICSAAIVPESVASTNTSDATQIDGEPTLRGARRRTVER